MHAKDLLPWNWHRGVQPEAQSALSDEQLPSVPSALPKARVIDVAT